ncbi:hypothetical protein HUK81_12865 [Komagataeibacter swingsii]|uniref:Uncharacterized protein n=1 Tax=Komagataeibacter swingsii TaxID=215220 RepID=A0A850P4Y4_9PROT|nr:hypothetical protein [Komagataeibacter swingsii]
MDGGIHPAPSLTDKRPFDATILAKDERSLKPPFFQRGSIPRSVLKRPHQKLLHDFRDVSKGLREPETVLPSGPVVHACMLQCLAGPVMQRAWQHGIGPSFIVTFKKYVYLFK